MSVIQTIKTPYRVFSANGTTSLSHFWSFAAVVVIANVAAGFLAVPLGEAGGALSLLASAIQLVTLVLTLPPVFVQAGRRLRDAGFSPRWLWATAAQLAAAIVIFMISNLTISKKAMASLQPTVLLLTGLIVVIGVLLLIVLLLPSRAAESGNKHIAFALERPASYWVWLKTQGWRHAIGVAVCIYALFPITYILSVSFSDGGGVDSGALFAQFSFQNYISLFTDDNPDRPFVRWIFNTVLIASITAVGSVFISALAAYSFSRMRFRGRRGGLLSLILLQMFPSILGLVAIYGILSELTKYVPAIGLNTQWGLILVYLGGSLGGGTYLMYGYFNTVPTELDEAAKIDGATHTQIYFKIILPLVAPILAVMALLSFIGTASDFILASIALNKPDQYTLAVGLGLFIDQPYSKNWAMFCAGAVISATPIVVLFMSLQRYIVSGLTGGAVKG